MEQWYVYVLRCSDNSLYTGITNNLERRLKEHNESKRGAKYTRSRRPVKLESYQEYGSRSSALKEEARFKSLSRTQKLEFINEFCVTCQCIPCDCSWGEY